MFYRTQSNIKVKKSELESNNMKEGIIEDTRTRKLEKKIDLILSKTKPDINYKKKI